MSAEWLDLFPIVFQVNLPNPTLDHSPIMLDMQCESWGPSLFCFELMWLEEKDLLGLIKDWWGHFGVQCRSGFVLAQKIRFLNLKIKEWAKSHFGELGALKSSILEEIQQINIME